MPGLADIAQRLVRLLLKEDAAAPERLRGIETVVDGMTAATVSEACLSEGASLGAGFPADKASRIWRQEQIRDRVNFLGGSLAALENASGRESLAGAQGLALSGVRATAFLSGPDLATAQDLLVQSAGRGLPMTVHLACRALDAHASTTGSGHEAYYLAANSGAVLLFAQDQQEAADLSLVARRVAEEMLVPVIVAQDGTETGTTAKNVLLPPVELVREYLGAPEDLVPAKTPAQEVLFGAHRRRTPRLFNLDVPALTGGSQPAEIWSLGAASKYPFSTALLAKALESAFARFHDLTGRSYGSVSTFQMQDAAVVFVAQGALVPVAESAAERLRAGGILAGVLGIRTLRPFPAAKVAELLKGRKVVAVLERVAPGPGGELPLASELRAAFAKALENGRFGADTNPGIPVWQEKDQPRLHSAVAGLGGRKVTLEDISALGKEVSAKGRPLVYLGMDFAPATASFPKRQPLQAALKRGAPEAAGLSLKGNGKPAPFDGLSLAVIREAGQDEGVSLSLALLLRSLLTREVTVVPVSLEETGACDVLLFTPKPLKSPEIPAGVDVTVALGACSLKGNMPNLRPDGVIFHVGTPSSRFASLFSSAWRRYSLRDVSLEETGGIRREKLLGGILGALAAAEMVKAKPRQIFAAREKQLHGLAEEEQDTLVAAFKGAFEGITGEPPTPPSHTIHPHPYPLPEGEGGRPAPLAVRHLRRGAAPGQSLPDFWDAVGAPWTEGAAGELSPDPFLGGGILPAFSASFHDHSAGRATLPVLDPSACTGCGKCWTGCPDGALAPVAIGGRSLVETGMALARANGVDTAALGMIKGKLASRLSRTVSEADPWPGQAGPLLAKAYEEVMAKTPVDEERKKGLDAAMKGVVDALEELPVSQTEPFFTSAENETPGSGELLVLALNADACKGCGLCVALCEDGALKAVPQTAAAEAEARKAWHLWERLPDTSGATIDRVKRHPQVGPLAAVLLSRHTLLSMTGGDNAEPGSGERLALRLVLALAEAERQPVAVKQLEEIKALKEKLAGRIRASLAEALPSGDLDALASGLENLSGGQVEFSRLMDRIQGAVGGPSVDAGHLKLLVETARRLEGHATAIALGEHGLGRARMGLIIGPGSVASWAGAFPSNPFQVPAAVASAGSVAPLSRGILEGQIRQAGDAIRAARLAQGLAEGIAGALSAEPPSWKAFSDEEKRLCPPLLVVINEEAFGADAAGLASLLESGLPVKVLAFTGLGPDTPDLKGEVTPEAAAFARRGDLGLLATAYRHAYVAQASLGNLDHFASAVSGALRFSGSAVIRIHTPSPRRHGFATDQTLVQAARALKTRMFPVYVFDPAKEGVFGTRFSLAGNPDPEALLTEGVNPLAWAASERRFAPWFAQASDESGALCGAGYFNLPPDKRSGKVPKKGKRPATPALVTLVNEQLHAWRTLQEISGVVTPFTGEVRATIEKELSAAHQAELAALKGTHEQQVRELEAKVEEALAQRLHGRLLALAGFGKN